MMWLFEYDDIFIHIVEVGDMIFYDHECSFIVERVAKFDPQRDTSALCEHFSKFDKDFLVCSDKCNAVPLCYVEKVIKKNLNNL